jgi:hypothetical protein
MKNVAETYKSSETHTSQHISCMSVAEILWRIQNNVLVFYIPVNWYAKTYTRVILLLCSW